MPGAHRYVLWRNFRNSRITTTAWWSFKNDHLKRSHVVSADCGEWKIHIYRI